MIDIKTLFNNRFVYARKKQWDKIYVLVDIHGTVIKSNYSNVDIPTEFYPLAKECLQSMSMAKDVCLILWTCSHKHEIEKYKELFSKNDIHFDYVNENPEIFTQENNYGCYDDKLYADMILDDKAGFDPMEDWLPLLQAIEESVPLDFKFDGYKNILLNKSDFIDNIVVNSNNYMIQLKSINNNIYRSENIIFDNNGHYIVLKSKDYLRPIWNN